MHFLSNVAFGGMDLSLMNQTIDDINARQAKEASYKYCSPSQLVSEYASSDLSKNPQPKLDFTLDEVKKYEACGDARTRAVASLMQASDKDLAAGLANILNVDALLMELRDFEQYLQIKQQVTKGWTTPQYKSWYYAEYWGDYAGLQKMRQALGAESEKRQKKQSALAELAKSSATTELSTPYRQYYVEIANKYGPSFSLAEQQQLKKFFVDTTINNWTVEDFLATGDLLSHSLSHEDLAKFYTYIPMAVTGFFFLGADGSPTAYMDRVKRFSDAGESALKQFLAPFNGASTVSMNQATAIAARCKNDAACIANAARDIIAGSPVPDSSDTINSAAKTVVFVASTFLLWKYLKGK